jgi:lipid A 3-O-deacylase
MKCLIPFAICLAVSPLAYGQEPTVQQDVTQSVRASDKKDYISLSFENDSIGNGTDSFYTNGVRLTWFNASTPVPRGLDRAANALPGFDLNATTSTFFSIGQNLYTPEDIRIRAAQDGDRPWAGWLYGSVGLSTVTDNHTDELEVTLGVVGPQAMGEQVQKFVHRHITVSPTPRGWNNQLEFEPGVILSWNRKWPQMWTADIGHDLRFAVQPSVNVSLGNIYTYAGSGLTLTFGPYQQSLQDTPPRVRPAMPGTGYFDVPDQKWSWFTFASLDGRAVARNIFLDGNTFRDSASVDKKPLVGDASAGVAFTYADYRLSYSLNYRTKEFDGQEDESVFGSLTLTSRF